eukprot:Sspe_Gene.10304::Locus_3443_Transcript_1_1_Confidence_1.000_Length_4216::g.10304::m.10304/K01530/E3.6.3.1; phospholipid-translocating ATPase
MPPPPTNNEGESEDIYFPHDHPPRIRKRDRLKQCLPCFKSRSEDDDRVIVVNDAHINRTKGFRDNTLKSSKYVFFNPFHPSFIIWKNLFEQFHRIANVYFLFMSALMQVPGLSPFGRWTVLSTLVFVMLVSMCKAIYEDVLRHQDDAKKNASLTQVLKNGEWTEVKWRDVQVGDIIRIHTYEVDEESGRAGKPVPCDTIILGAKGNGGIVYVETMDLDGETNLKPREVISMDQVQGMPDTESERNLFFLNASNAGRDPLTGAKLTCEPPGADLSKFWGKLEMGGKEIVLDHKNLLLRGARLCKTEEAVGVVVYTGHETRLGCNMKEPRAKLSRMERLTNYRLGFILILKLIMCIVSAIGYNAWGKTHGDGAWYVDEPTNDAAESAVAFWSFFILYNNLIPISMYVSMELTKFFQGKLMAQDLAIYDEEKDLPANVRTTDINDELGQVAHVFSDKTGTLTRNVMQLFKFYADGEVYGEGLTSIGKAAAERAGASTKDSRPKESQRSTTWPFYDPRIQDHESRVPTWNSSKMGWGKARQIRLLLESLSICNTVLPAQGGAFPDHRIPGIGVGKLEAESPDELALVTAAGELGVALTEATQESKTIEMRKDCLPNASGGNEEGTTEAEWTKIEYKVLATLEFDSMRKRMSVIVRRKESEEDPQGGRLYIYCKGADSAMEPLLCSSFNDSNWWQHPKVVEDWATNGTEWKTHRKGEGVRETSEREEWYKKNSWRRMSYYEEWVRRGRFEEAFSWLKEQVGENCDEAADWFQTFWMANNDNPVSAQTHQLAEEGLRTLYICRKRLNEDDFEQFITAYQSAKSMQGTDKERKTAIEEASRLIEKDLNLVGVTAIEDKLQDRVPETIAALRDAGIRVWMITGDKKNTAINIAHACSLLDTTLDDPKRGVHPIELDGEHLTKDEVLQMLDKAVEKVKNMGDKPYAVILTSSALKHILVAEDDPKLKLHRSVSNPAEDKLYAVTESAASVIVARSTPMQKSQVVDMIKSRNEWSVTLAIGDGANDVAMIQQAHVGIGIKGLEGGQAAAQADFSIGQFKYLHRLLLVHGRWNYRRLAFFCCYFFYKNAVVSLSLFFYNFLNGFSGQSIYDPWVLAGFNVAWASWPIIIVATFDRDVLNTDNMHDFPLLYKHGRLNSDYTCGRLMQWYFNAIFHALACTFIPIIVAMPHNIMSDGHDFGMYHLGVNVYTNVVVIITFKLCLHVASWTWIHHFFIWSCLLSWPAFLPFYAEISPYLFQIYTMTYSFRDSFLWNTFWLLLFLVFVVCLLRDYVWRYSTYHIMPMLPPEELEQRVSKKEKEPGFKHICSLRPMSLMKIIQLLDKRLQRPSWRTPAELLPQRLPYGQDIEDKSKDAEDKGYGHASGDCGCTKLKKAPQEK